MSVPFALMPSGYDQTMAQIRHALETRLKNETRRLSVSASFHRGTPDLSTIPNDQVGVWLDWTSIDPNEDDTNEAEALQSTWMVYIITRDETNDQFGTMSDVGLRMWGDVMRTFTETIIDLGLDGSCDVLVTPSTRHFRPSSGGNRDMDVIEMTLLVVHSFELTRMGDAAYP